MSRVVATSLPGPLVTTEYGLWAELRYYAGPSLDVKLVEEDETPQGCSTPAGSWTVDDSRLMLSRRVEGWRCPGGEVILTSDSR